MCGDWRVSQNFKNLDACADLVKTNKQIKNKKQIMKQSCKDLFTWHNYQLIIKSDNIYNKEVNRAFAIHVRDQVLKKVFQSQAHFWLNSAESCAWSLFLYTVLWQTRA